MTTQGIAQQLRAVNPEAIGESLNVCRIFVIYPETKHRHTSTLHRMTLTVNPLEDRIWLCAASSAHVVHPMRANTVFATSAGVSCSIKTT